jgi:lantibiotic leader peptide-processing serine protease
VKRSSALAGVAVAAVIGGTLATLPATAQAEPLPAASGPQTEYVVAAKDGADLSAAAADVRAAGGRVVKTNPAAGTLTAMAPAQGFVARVGQRPTLLGAARNAPVGKAPDDVRPSRDQIEKLSAAERRGAQRPQVKRPDRQPGVPAPEPLAGLQWDMQQIGATPTGSYARERGSRQVLVGVMDTGIDGTHPDIAPNFDAALSRNFTTDIPEVDGPCEVPSCVDPANVDDNEHGTHVASTIGSPINGLGVAGVAPGVRLVNIRAGQDSGYFFLGPVVDALVYAGQTGIDVVNMSFYVDPWLYNCAANPADSAEAQAEQRTVRALVQRAADYARNRGVTLVAAMGNEATDLGHPVSDDTSPDFPASAAYHRDVDNTCLSVPTETRGVIAVTATARSLRKAYYSNYGPEQADVAAPGGDAYDTPAGDRDISGLVLAAYPEKLALESGAITPLVVRDCQNGTCAYYQYLQGTSMASPHAAGVAALIVARYGSKDHRHGGLTLSPQETQRILYATAARKACPTPAAYTYTLKRPTGTETVTHTCEGTLAHNGFYGHGIVNAAAAVAGRR